MPAAARNPDCAAVVHAKATKDEQPFKEFVAITFGSILAPPARA